MASYLLLDCKANPAASKTMPLSHFDPLATIPIAAELFAVPDCPAPDAIQTPGVAPVGNIFVGETVTRVPLFRTSISNPCAVPAPDSLVASKYPAYADWIWPEFTLLFQTMLSRPIVPWQPPVQVLSLDLLPASEPMNPPELTATNWEIDVDAGRRVSIQFDPAVLLLISPTYVAALKLLLPSHVL